jgi:DNA topoisomerase-1
VRVLVVAEKNNAAVRIATILSNGKAKRTYAHRVPVFAFSRDGDEYVVLGLRGHILNLDYPKELNRWEDVDLKELVWAEPVKRITAKGVVATLRERAKDKDVVVVATDFDREGELIGKEALDIVQDVNPNVRVRRARFSALTKGEVEKAFRELADLDMDLAESAESRQIVDLAWGAALTRFMSLATNQRGRDFLSVGRVQSPTLALVVDRERTIRDFLPEPYWTIHVLLEKGETFRAAHEGNPFWRKDAAEAAHGRALLATEARVVGYEAVEKEEWPPVPFHTTAFLSEANRLGFGAARAMTVAEGLYQKGLISYPRTDNQVYPPSLNLRSVLEKLRASDLGKEAEEILAQETIRPRRGKRQTTDHPPIYPVAAARKADLKRDEWRIYELVVRRFLATLAPNAVARDVTARVDVGGEPFVAKGHRILDPGWRKYYPYWKVRESDLPELAEGDGADILAVDLGEDKTKPPDRYTEGALLREMEKKGLGTKATRHEIIRKLYDRGYVEGKTIQPTTSGVALIEALEAHARKITEADMTSHLEADMEAISRGVRTKEEVVKESQQMLEEAVEVLEAHKEAIGREINAALSTQNLVGTCRACGGDLLLRQSRRGARFVGCSNYPECKVTHPVPQSGLVAPAEEACPECGGPMVQHIVGGRTSAICIDAECPSVKEKTLIGPCTKCGDGELHIRHSSRGKRFVGCSNYPDCDHSFPLPQRGLVVPTTKVCTHCGSPIVKIVTRGRSPWVLCLNMECPGRKKGKGKA